VSLSVPVRVITAVTVFISCLCVDVIFVIFRGRVFVVFVVKVVVRVVTVPLPRGGGRGSGRKTE
jgi:hypothetical protein